MVTNQARLASPSAGSAVADQPLKSPATLTALASRLKSSSMFSVPRSVTLVPTVTGSSTVV